MLQFSLRSLFVTTFVAALFLGIAQTTGYVVSAGIFVAISVLVWAVVFRRHGAFIYIRIGSAVFALVAIWFLAVDWSWFVADCQDCGYIESIHHYRVLGMPVRTQVQDFPSKTQLILDDLGVPCMHGNCELLHFRASGLVLPTWPGISDMLLVNNTDDYTDAMAEKVRRLGAEDPELAAQLHDIVIRQHDYQSFRQTIEDRIGEPIRSGPLEDGF